MTLIKRSSIFITCAALVIGTWRPVCAATNDVTLIEDTAEISDCEAGTYQIVEETSEGKSITTFIVGESYAVQDECDKNIMYSSAKSTSSSSQIYGRTLTQINEYYDLMNVQVYKTTNDASFYWDNTNVWVDSCQMSERHASGYSKNVTLTSADRTKSARLYAWSRYHVTYTSSSRTFNTVNDVGCSHYGDSNYIKE